MLIDYGKGEKEAIFSAYTLMLYEQEFKGGNLVGDCWGRVELADGANDGEVVFSYDYNNINWTAYTRAVWAALKTADDSIAPFARWSREFAGANLHEIKAAVDEEIARNFFRAGASVSA